MNKKIEMIEKIHNKEICMYKTGNFYHVYNKNAYILSYIVGYKLKKVNENLYECGFPKSVLPKVEKKLEECQIHCIEIDRRNNYDVDKKIYYEENKYDEYLEKAEEYINRQKRINILVEKLQENIETKDFIHMLQDMEKVAKKYER